MSSVRLCDFHTGLNTSKIIARRNSLGSLLSMTPTGAVWCNANTPNIGVEYGWGQMKRSDEAHKSHDFPCFLTFDVTSHWAAINRCHAYGKPLYYLIHNSWYVGLHIMNSNSWYNDFFSHAMLCTTRYCHSTGIAYSLSVSLWRTSGTSTVLT